MAIQFSVAVRNARLDAVEATAGAAAKLRIYTGSVPANCAAAATGTLLVEIVLPSDWASAASNGSKVKAGTWSANAAAGGTAGYFRVVDNAGTTCHIQGTVGQASGDLSLDNAVIAANQLVSINTFTLTDANS